MSALSVLGRVDMPLFYSVYARLRDSFSLVLTGFHVLARSIGRRSTVFLALRSSLPLLLLLWCVVPLLCGRVLQVLHFCPFSSLPTPLFLPTHLYGWRLPVQTMDFSGMEDSLAAFIILIIVTWLWHLVCFFVLAKRLLPDFWVQRAVAEMGQSMGVTATGLLLLRMSDPHHKSPALVAFSYKQLLHEPIVGGGLWTASVLPFIAAAGIWPAVGTAWGALAFWAVVYFAYFRPRFKLGRAKGQKEGVAGDFGPVKGDHDKHMSNEESPLLLVSTAESAA